MAATKPVSATMVDQGRQSEGGAPIPREWLAEFEAAAARPLEVRLRYAFVNTYKPVLDDAPYRSFGTMEEYREWCNTHLPGWLGYGV